MALTENERLLIQVNFKLIRAIVALTVAMSDQGQRPERVDQVIEACSDALTLIDQIAST